MGTLGGGGLAKVAVLRGLSVGLSAGEPGRGEGGGRGSESFNFFTLILLNKGILSYSYGEGVRESTSTRNCPSSFCLNSPSR